MANYRSPEALREGNFADNIEGKEVRLYHLQNRLGMSADIMNHGGKIVSLIVPDAQGRPVDVVLGHDSLADYCASEEQYFGAICGRYANRIARGKFSIGEESFELPVNNGPNSLHGGIKGFNDVAWEVVSSSERELVLQYVSADGEEGYPGELTTRVTYRLSETQNRLEIEYEATTTKPTVLNLTNHSYFNLSGEGDASVHDHILEIKAEYYLPTDETAIPYGEPESVAGTPFDFRTPHTIGERIDQNIDQLTWARGYDHTFVLDKVEGELAEVAICWSPKSGIRMSVITDQPGMQLYTGNWMSGNMRGKGSSKYPARSAVCFETQHFPDSPNKPNYPSTLLEPGETFRSKTLFSFSAEETR